MSDDLKPGDLKTEDLKTEDLGVVTVALVPLALAALAVAAPLLATSPLLSVSIRKFFSVVCHQDAARSFWIAGAPVAVCVRCLGIYLGAALGAFFSASRMVALRIVALTATLNALDVAAEWGGLHGNLPAMRFVFGLALGAAVGALVLSSLRDSFVTPASSPHLPDSVAR